MSATKSKAVKSDSKDAGKSTRQAVVAKLGKVPLLGEIVTWSARSDRTFKHADIIKALNDCGLDPKVAREIMPRHAFSRAMKKMEADRVIDWLKEEGEDIVFQFTKKVMADSNGHSEDELDREWQYRKEVTLRLNKLTGKVTCRDDNLEKFAQKEVERNIEERNTSDVTKIVQTLYERNADLFAIRDQGGAYFVPAEHTGFTDKVQEFLEVKLGGRVNRFPVPQGSVHADRAVSDSIHDNLQAVIEEYNDAVKDFSIHTRVDTMEGAANRIKKTRLKVEAYAHYLGAKKVELEKALEEAEENLRKQIEGITETRRTAPPDSQAAGNRATLFTYTITAVLRWMGKNGFDFDKAEKALAKHSITIAPATIRAQLLAGRKGERGDPAPITAEQAEQLKV